MSNIQVITRSIGANQFVKLFGIVNVDKSINS